MKAEKDLEDVEVEAMMKIAELESERDYLFLCLIGPDRGLRIGECTGVRQRTTYTTWKDRTEHSLGRVKKTSVTDLPGIYVSDLREQAIWVKRKGGRIRRVKLTLKFWTRLKKYAQTLSPEAKLFGFRERTGYDHVRNYARKAGVEDWEKVHPHRLRHYFITRAHEIFQDVPTVQDLAGHSSPRTTMRYIRKLTPEKELEKLEQLEAQNSLG